MAVAINGQLLSNAQEMTLSTAVRNLLIDMQDLEAKDQAISKSSVSVRKS